MELFDSALRAKARDQKEMRKFGLAMAWAIPLLFGVTIPLVFGTQKSLVPWITGIVFGFFALVFPQMLGWIYMPWMTVAGIMGMVNQRIILFAFFYFIITPIALIMKLVGRDSMNRKTLSSAASYRVEREDSYDTQHMERPF